jgi:hypothetical protein
MKPRENRRDYLLRRAKESREHAGRMPDCWIKRDLERIAQGFERLAEKETEGGSSKPACRFSSELST